MPRIIYILCALTALTCAWLLLRNYLRTRSRLLLWSSLCFSGLTLHNFLRAFGRFIVPDYDFITLRMGIALIALSLLLYGLIWEEE